MATNAVFKLYNSANTVLVYTFTYVQDTNHNDLGSKEYVSLENGRAKGAIYVDGGVKSEDLFISAFLKADNYDGIIVAIDALTTAIVQGTPYTLRVYKTASTYYSYKVKRIDNIQFKNVAENRQVRKQDYTVVFKNNAW